jgi:hypothetical protein
MPKPEKAAKQPTTEETSAPERVEDPRQKLLTDAARFAHQINRAMRAAVGEEPGPTWEEAPHSDQVSSMIGVAYIIENPDANPEDLHASWLETKVSQGWKHGAVKSIGDKIHPNLVPYEQLPASQKLKDHLFGAVVREFLALSK